MAKVRRRRVSWRCESMEAGRLESEPVIVAWIGEEPGLRTRARTGRPSNAVDRLRPVGARSRAMHLLLAQSESRPVDRLRRPSRFLFAWPRARRMCARTAKLARRAKGRMPGVERRVTKRATEASPCDRQIKVESNLQSQGSEPEEPRVRVDFSGGLPQRKLILTRSLGSCRPGKQEVPHACYAA